MCSLDFSEITRSVKHEKVDKNDRFGFRKFLLYPKWGKWVIFCPKLNNF